MIRAILFDVDGTLAETEELHRRAFNDTFAAFGLDWHWDRREYTELLRITGGKERIAAYIGQRPGGDPQAWPIARIHAAKTETYAGLIGSGALRLRPGIAELIEDAWSHKLPIAVATTTSRSNVDALIRATMGLPAERVFDAIAAGDEVARKKPAPDVYELALSRLGIGPEGAVALEDSLNGARAALAAGLSCFVSSGPYTAHETLPEAAIRLRAFSEIDTVARLAARLDCNEACA